MHFLLRVALFSFCFGMLLPALNLEVFLPEHLGVALVPGLFLAMILEVFKFASRLPRLYIITRVTKLWQYLLLVGANALAGYVASWIALAVTNAVFPQLLHFDGVALSALILTILTSLTEGGLPLSPLSFKIRG